MTRRGSAAAAALVAALWVASADPERAQAEGTRDAAPTCAPTGQIDAVLSQAIRDAGPFPAIPVRVLTGRGQPESMPNLRRAWAEAQADLARLSPLATQEICESCGHFVQRDAPDLVVDAIRSLVE